MIDKLRYVSSSLIAGIAYPKAFEKSGGPCLYLEFQGTQYSLNNLCSIPAKVKQI